MFYCAFGAAQFLGDFAYAALVDKPAHDDETLVWQKAINQTEQDRTLLGLVIHSSPFQIIARNFLLSSSALPSFREQLGGNSQQPRHKRDSAPLKLTYARQRLMKSLCGQVFCLLTVANPPGNVGINPIKVIFV